MSVKKPALGRGLEAILQAQTPVASLPRPEAASLRQIPVEEISPNPYQPRRAIDPDGLSELVASIRQKGVLQPVVLRRAGSGYQLVAGERRWRAAQEAGLAGVPAVVREFDDRQMMEAALIENLQREDLNPVEEARAFERLIGQFGLTQEAVAEAVGKSRVTVTNLLRLLRLPDEALRLIERGQLTEGHGRALLGLAEPRRQLELARRVVRRGLSVRETERLVQRAPREAATGGWGRRRAGQPVEGPLAEMEQRLERHLGLRVRIVPATNHSGRVEIHYESIGEFERLCDRLGLPKEDPL